MSMLTQGSSLFFIDPETNAVIEVECVTTFEPGGAPADQLDDTCMADTSGVRSFRRGLKTPGQATLGINADPNNPSHVRLYELFSEDSVDVINWALGWSDGVAVPTADSNGEFNLPTTRTWFTFAGYVSDFPFSFAINALVASTVTVQRSGPGIWTRKTT